MARLTKSEIEQNLLTGKKVEWKDAAGKKASIILDNPEKRRLFAYVLSSPVRDVKGIPDDCVKGLAMAYSATDDPGTHQAANGGTTAKTGPWKLHSIKTEGFGGVNAWNGKPFELGIEGSSYLLEGPNGSGKSSFASAIIWALCGERPRDQAESSSDESKPVFNTENIKAGDWPPVATYPEDLSGILSDPKVSVELTFTNPSGATAAVRRVFDGGKITHVVDPQLNIPPILVETGFLMPSRLPKLRLDEGRGKLTDAVQKLTGLDELVELGVFIIGLCNSGRDYLKYIKSELQSAKISFDKQVASAKSALAAVGVVVPDFKIEDTDDLNGAMAKFGKEQVEKASDLSKVVSDDLATGLNLSDSQTQKKIRIALAGADEDIKLGLAGLQQWKSFEAIVNALPAKKLQEMADAVAHAKASLASAIEYHNKAISDTRYRLKAAAARWHAEHGSGLIEDCPTCMQSLKEKPEFQAELTELQNAGEAATRKLSDNVNAILAELENTVPQTMRRYLSESVSVEPRADLVKDFETTFVRADRYQNYLSKCGELSKSALKIAPSAEMKAPPEEEQTAPETETVVTRISKMEKLSSLATWFDTERAQWLEWWKDLSTANLLPDGTTPVSDQETLSAYLSRVSKALEDAEPYSLGAEAMREAWKQGVAARKIEQEFEQRQAIADALAPLKELGKLAEAQARDTLNELSAKIGKIHKANYLSDSLKFESAKLEKKEGLVVRGQLGDEICIDATLVANTSWIRGVLWAFIFALREEAVEQMGGDEFPIMVLDDPQQTFDTIHRHRWAEYIAKLQSTPPAYRSSWLHLMNNSCLFSRLTASQGDGHSSHLPDLRWVI